MLPSSSTKDKTRFKWLRTLEISVGVIILVLGIILWWPGPGYGDAFFTFLAIPLIALEIVYLIRIYAQGISAGQHPTLILSVLAILMSVLVLATLSSDPVGLFAVGLLFAGVASAAYGTTISKIVGVLAILVTLAVFMYPEISGILALLIIPVTLVFPDFIYSEIPGALVTLCLMILALEPLVSGITGRQI